jgi:hypothetical protein
VIAVCSIFAGFYGVGNIINRIDELKIRQVTLEVNQEVIKRQLQDMKVTQQKYWDELKRQGLIKRRLE